MSLFRNKWLRNGCGGTLRGPKSDRLLGISALLGITAYGGAFVLALGLDQPFGPILVVVCLGLGGLVGRSA